MKNISRNMKRVVLEPIKESSKKGMMGPKKKNLSYIEEMLKNPVL